MITGTAPSGGLASGAGVMIGNPTMNRAVIPFSRRSTIAFSMGSKPDHFANATTQSNFSVVFRRRLMSRP